jgi:hypothetical protein
MIQRIQSLFLFLVLALCLALFYLPLYSVHTAGSAADTDVFIQSNKIYLLFTSIIGLFSLAAILLFKNRVLQIRLCNLNMLVICIFVGTVFYFSDHSVQSPGSVIHYQSGCYVPLVQLLFSFLAMRAIRKDEELVRSADRLR